MNTQKPSKLNHSTDNISVHSIFKTIQGEGPFTGYPALFVRLFGCNLMCPACDTDYTSVSIKMKPYDLADEIIKQADNVRLIVVTGGEPLRQGNALAIVCKVLLARGYTVQIETNGTMPIPQEFPSSVNIVVSPKATKLHPSFEQRIKQGCNNIKFKYVLNHKEVEPDGLPTRALEHRATPYIARPPKCYNDIIYLQPMDSYDNEENLMNTKAVVDSCLANGYVVQLQLHKIIEVE